MGFTSWVKSIFSSKEKEIENEDSFPISKIETPSKVIETRLKPIKIPTIVDIGERLGLISREIGDLRDDMVTKTWFKLEYEDSSPEIVNKLNHLEEALSLLKNDILRLNKNLSKFTKTPYIKKEEVELSDKPILNTQVRILNFIEQMGPVRYKDLRGRLNITDPTLSKYLKILCKTNKIERKKSGKAVYYELKTL
jgi:hypothetical protein